MLFTLRLMFHTLPTKIRFFLPIPLMLLALALTEPLPQELSSSESSRPRPTFTQVPLIKIALFPLSSHSWSQQSLNSLRKKSRLSSDNNNHLFFCSEAMPPI